MNIKEAKNITGLSEQMIRFYEKKKIIYPLRDKENNYRLYTNHEIFLMVMARSYNSLGIPLDEVSSYIKPTNTEDTLDKLSKTVQSLENEEIWLHEKIRFSKDLQSIFFNITQNKEYSIVHFDTLYFYPNNNSVYPSIFKKIGVSRAALRVTYNTINKNEYPNDKGILLTIKIDDPSIHLIEYKDITVLRFYCRTPVSKVISPSEIHQIMSRFSSLGYILSGDSFIYQVAEYQGNTNEDIVCVDFIVNEHKK